MNGLLLPARQLIKAAADLLSPPVCPACGADTATGGALCADCFADARFLHGPVCAGCARPAPALPETGDYRCTECLAMPHVFAEARAAAAYGGSVRRLILALKHADRLDHAPLLAGWMARAAGPLLDEADMIVPVPLHWRRRLARRANQSAEIARHLAAPGRPFRPDLLRRVRATPSQGGLDRAARRANLAGAFALSRRASEALSGRRILLVDDVLTTGATLDTAAEALVSGGAARVDALVIAVVEGNHDPYVPASTRREAAPGNEGRRATEEEE